MKTSHYLINAVFAKANKLPVSFVGIEIRSSKKAVWIYGHGAMDPFGHCARCGRTLTHPGSILIGIGPECLEDWGARDIRLENMTDEDKKHIQSLVTDKKVDSWIPKSCIKQVSPATIEIHLPKDHKSLPKEDATETTPGKPAPHPHQKTTTAVKEAVYWKEKDKIGIRFPYSYDTLQQVKSLEGRAWHGEGKFWSCPVKSYSLMRLKEWGFVLDATLTKILIEEMAQDVKNRVTADIADHNRKVTSINTNTLGLKRELFDFQKEGVAFIESRKGRALVGDEMGLGKTIQAIAFLQLHPEYRPAIILCPASLKLNWAKEIQMTMSGDVRIQILEGKTPYRLHGNIIIVNYDILSNWVKSLLAYNPMIIVADECHYFKSNSALRTKAVKLLAKPVPHFIALSGTPIINRPIEIYNALSIINSSVIPGFWEFAKKYCGAVHNGFGWDFTGATNTEELHKILTNTIMIRRKKADVLKDLPDKIHSIVPMTLSNQQEYNSIESDVIEYLRRAKGEAAADKASNAETMVQIELLKQAAVRGKLNAVMNWIDDFLESDEKLVLFMTHKFVVDALMARYGTMAVKIVGGMTTAEKEASKDQFQTNPKVKLIFGNIDAMGVGWTLTASSNVGFIEYPWTPGQLKQGEDRCHRIGQKYTVNVHMFVAPGTVEEEIAELLDKKTKVLDAVLDGKETLQGSLLTELIGSITRKSKK